MIRKRTNNEVLIASGDDAVWFQDSKENYAIINSMMFLKGKFNIESFRDLVMEKIITAKNERNEWLAEKCICYPSKILHRYVWRKEEKFDIKDHVYVWDGDIPKTQTEMEALLSHLSSIPFSEGKSPWEMVIVPCYKDKTAISQGSGDEDDVFPLVFRVHHSIGDGVSLMRLLMQQLMDVKPKKGDLPQRFASKDWLWRAAKAIVTGPAMIIGRICWPPDHHALHGPGLTGQKLFTWSHNLDLDLIKRMKNATGTTVNDILMTCLAGAFHEYFRRHASKTPPDLLTYVPVDIRSHTAELVLDNQFALVFLKLPLDIEDRMTRLSETKARMDRIKMSAEPVVNALTIRYLMARFPNWLTRILFDNVASKCSLVLSNVPGPQEPLYIGDLKLEQMVFWPPQRCNVGKTSVPY